MSNKTNMQSVVIPGASNFRFSAVRPDELGATEYTLVTIAVDISSSINGFERELKDAVKEIIEASRQSPRADNLLVRLLSFNTTVTEVFGFKAIQDIDSRIIDDFKPYGMTALFDATMDTVVATEQYSKLLYDQDFDANATIYIITDGWDNRSSRATPKKIANRIKAIRKNEQLESILFMLIGVNTTDQNVASSLQEYSAKASFDRYIDIGNANKKNLSKLAGYVSQSISSQSRSLGTGSTSLSLTF